MNTPKLAVLIPARNEEKSIKDSIVSLFRSNFSIEQVIVISDNSTDDTVRVTDRLRNKYPRLRVISTKNNKARKAGALNRAIRQYCVGCDYVMVLDADTRVHPYCISEGIKLLEADKSIGGICARTHVSPLRKLPPKDILPPEEEVTKKIYLSKNTVISSNDVTQKIAIFKNPIFLNDEITKKILVTNTEKSEIPKIKFSERIWWQLQRLEYATADSNRVENLGNIQILAGSCVIYRMAALKQVAEKRGNGQFYDEGNLIEDYELTIHLRQLGWKATIGLKMDSWTDVPLSLKIHWQQRIRWARSHIDTLREKGWNRVTRGDIFGHILFVLIFPQQLIFLALLVYLIATGVDIIWNPLLWIILFTNWASRMYRLKYVPDLKVSDVITRALFIPEELYGIYQSIQRTYSYWLAFTNGPEEWHET